MLPAAMLPAFNASSGGFTTYSGPIIEGCPGGACSVDPMCVRCWCEEPKSGGSGGVQDPNIERLRESGHVAIYRMGDRRGTTVNQIEKIQKVQRTLLYYDHLWYATADTVLQEPKFRNAAPLAKVRI